MIGTGPRMTVEYVRYRVKAGDRNGFMLGLAHAVKQLETNGSCLGYELTESMDDPEIMVLRIEWTKGGGRFRFRDSAFFPGLISDGRPFADLITDMHHYKLTGISKWK